MNTASSFRRVLAALAVTGTLVMGAVIYSSTAVANVAEGPHGNWSKLPGCDLQYEQDAGGDGDTPPGNDGYGADDVPCPTQEPAPLSATTCPVVGKACVDLCMAEANKWCPAFAEHPPKQGLGALVGCCGCKGTGYCEFVWGANERCRWYEMGQWLCF